MISLIRDIEDYFDNKCGDIVKKAKVPFQKTALERLLNRAFHANSQGRQDVNALDVLLSIFQKRKVIVYILKNTS